jgi:magnesium chelatase family protein
MAAPQPHLQRCLPLEFSASAHSAAVFSRSSRSRRSTSTRCGSREPGSGKTMLARRLPTILPAMTPEEAPTVTAVHSVAGLLGSRDGLVRARPFRAPHHTLSAAALLGGGQPLRPGEVSLAHHGCLFLDELLEFRRHVLEGLRQPLEDGQITICRARQRVIFPARPLMVAAINPCPCGHFQVSGWRCRGSPDQVHRYRSRLSGPLTDRIDVHVILPAVGLDELQQRGGGEPSRAVRARVELARARQLARHAACEASTPYNAELSTTDLDRVAPLDAAGSALLRGAVDRYGLSARGYVKLRRVARSIADLDGSDAVCREHLAEAMTARALDRLQPGLALAS